MRLVGGIPHVTNSLFVERGALPIQVTIGTCGTGAIRDIVADKTHVGAIPMYPYEGAASRPHGRPKFFSANR